jgi:CBS domain-containing protein
MKVSELMKSAVVSVLPETPVAGAARLLSQYNIGVLPVCGKDGRLCGMVTDRDIVTRCVAAEENPQTLSVREIMSRNVECALAAEDVRDAARRMADKRVRRLPVTDENGKLSGILSLGDLAKARSFSMETANALSEISDNVKRGTSAAALRWK